MIVGLKDMLAGEQWRVRLEAAMAVDRILNLEAIALPNDIVVLTMARGGMHGPGAGLGRDMIAEDDGHLAIIKRMTQSKSLQGIATASTQYSKIRDLITRQSGLMQDLGKHKPFLAAVLMTALDQHILKARIQCNSLVGRQRPGRRRPNHKRCVALSDGAAETAVQFSDITNAKTHIDGRRGAFLVFDLGLGQRRTAIATPMDGFKTLMEMTRGDQSTQGAHDIGLEMEGHGQIGPLPVAEHT